MVKHHREGMYCTGRVSVCDNGASYRLTPDKEAIEAAGRPDQATQYIDLDRGIIVFDLVGGDGGE